MKKEIQIFQTEMIKRNIQMCLIPTGDYHLSEYIDDYFKVRAFLSGFTGSAGTLLITTEKAMLWTDGRYFIQAGKQLKDTEIELMKSGEEGVLEIEEYIRLNLRQGEQFSFDGRVLSAKEGKNLSLVVKECGGIIENGQWIDEWLDKNWQDRPSQNFKQAERLGLFLTGRRTQEKIEMVRNAMAEVHADCHILSSLDDLAWLYNLRGEDILHNPVFYSFSVITSDEAYLFMDEKAADKSLLETLSEEHVTVMPYDEFYKYVNTNIKNQNVLVDSANSAYALVESLGKPESENKIIDKENPTLLFKAVKTAVETDNIRKAQEIDGLAMIHFIYWVKDQVSKIQESKEKIYLFTERAAADYLDKLRLSHQECTDISFDTIAAYGENAAICHYSPDENSAEIKPEGFLLVDSGGQYTKGTTDITRTIAMGELTEQQKKHYTLVLRGHIRLAMARFPKGTCGANLDVLARGPLWEQGLDYNHGTGHGVGYYLNVHEGPQNINWKIGQRKGNTTVLQPGMLTSNEPGLYLEGEYGIRLENLILTKTVEEPGMKNFLEFETMTFVPFEREAILPELLEEKEKTWLNEYHQKIYEMYAKKVSEEERNWLRSATLPL